jgi:hypothetical protein
MTYDHKCQLADAEKRTFRWPLLVWLVNRAFLFAVAWMAICLLPMRASNDLWNAYPGANPLNSWIRWDSGWYAGIAQDGYIAAESIQEGQQRNTAFFPLYPVLTRYLTPIFGDVYISGLIIANLAFLLGLLLLHDMVRKEHGEDAARKTTALLLFHPCSFFFSAMYTESLFFLASVLFFYCCKRDRWGYAGLCTAAAVASRVVGIIFIPVLAIAVWRRYRTVSKCIHAAAPAILLGLTGAASYPLFLAFKYGNPLEFCLAQNVEGWGAGLFIFPQGPMDVFNLLFLPLAIYLLHQGRRLLQPEVIMWTFCTLVLSITRWPSMSRLVLVLFPLFVVAALKIRNRKVFSLVVAISTVLLIATTIRFSLWYWVA